MSVQTFPGLSPDLQSMEQIRRIMRPTDVPDTGMAFLALHDIMYAFRFFGSRQSFVK